MADTVKSLPSKKPLWWLALGAFSIATEAFMIAPLLPDMAADLSVSLAAAGQLVTVFALVYALSSPILTTLTGSLNRRDLLIVSLGCFALANVVAFASSDYATLMIARVLLALAAGLYLPNASAVAGALVAPEQRGRALAIVTGGSSLAMALGVPLGAVIGDAAGWRMTFAGVAVLAIVGTLGLVFGLPKEFGKGFPTATLRQRITVARKPIVLLALVSTLLWATGAYAVYTYVAAYVDTVAGADGIPLASMLLVWGIAAVVGIFGGGRLTDKLGPRRTIVLALTLLSFAFFALSAIAKFIPYPHALPLLVATLVLWGIAAWGFIAPQQVRLIGVAGVDGAPVALSLNASFMYFGSSLGAALGALTLSQGTASDLGWVAAICELASLAILVVAERQTFRTMSAIPTG